MTRRLLDAGLFTKAADPKDKRLLLIGLSDEGAERIRAYLAASGGLVGLAA
jgi:DNA-binding MarR family transcriptional regulator